MRTSFYTPFPGAAERLIVFHHAGGSRMSFAAAARRLAPRLELALAEYPGRHGTENPSLAEYLAEVEEELSLSRKPYSLFGHSMGSLLAYELARRLEDSPKRLVVSACWSPDKRPWPHENPDPSPAELERILQQYGSASLQPEIKAHLLPLLKRDMQWLWHFPKTSGPVSVPLLALGGREDPMVKEPDLEGWRPYTEKEFRLEMLPGGHFYTWESAAAFERLL